MLTQHIKAQRLHLLDIIDERFVRGRRHQALRPVALVQNAVKEIRLSVEQKARCPFRVFSDAKRAHGKIALDHIYSRLDPQGIELRVFGAPQAGLRDRNAGGDFVPERERDPFLALIDKDPRLRAVLRLSAESHLQLHRLLFRIRRDLQLSEINFRDRLQPRRLPDAALRVIEHAARLQGLLAAALFSLIRVVPDKNLQFIGAGLHKLRDVKRKREITVSVAPDFMAVPVHRAALIHRAEVKEEPSALRKMQIFKLFPVPERLSRQERPAHAGPLCLRRKRDQYCAVGFSPRRLSRVCAPADPVLPPAVETDPILPLQLRPGVFRQRNRLRAVIGLLTPDGAEFAHRHLLFLSELHG